MSVIEVANSVGLMEYIDPYLGLGDPLDAIEDFAEKIRADEREECARVCDVLSHKYHAIFMQTQDAAVFAVSGGMLKCAEAIRNIGANHE